MGRGVSYPNDCTSVCYQDVSYMEDSWEWDDFVGSIRAEVEASWKSMSSCSEWLDNEDRAIMENQHAYIGVSEYCGLASIWLKSKGDDLRNDGYADRQSAANLADNWCEQISTKFESLFGQYKKIGIFSNGESFYERV